MREKDISSLIDDAKKGSHLAVAKLMSVVERGGDPAIWLDKTVYPFSGVKRVIGITGPPGAGKSSLTSKLVKQLRQKELTVAVLAVDPSSPFSGGAILGDRVRMNEHALDEKVFIRSFATRGHLGGLSYAIPKAIRVLEYLNFDLIIIETVGVGQVELEVIQVAHDAVVVVNPGWGDSVQAAKAGLLEIGDIFVINKADRAGVKETERDLKSMLEMGRHGAWMPPIVKTVAINNEGINELDKALDDHWNYLNSTGLLKEINQRHVQNELDNELLNILKQRVSDKFHNSVYQELAEKVIQRKLDPYSAALELTKAI